MPLYTEKVMDHFANPRNVGEIPDADGIGEEGNPVCGDMMTFYIKVKDDHLEDVKFKTFGCGAAIAVSSMVSEMAIGKTLEEAKKITREQVAEELGGLPPNKMHCSNLGADALQKAIANYESKQQAKAVCRCPFCDEELKEAMGTCTGCGAQLSFCSHCGKPLPKGAATCPECGAAKS
jgi:nitrogen fixation NifU-like protein